MPTAGWAWLSNGCEFSLPMWEQYFTPVSHRLRSGAQGANRCRITLLTHIFTEYFSYTTELPIKKHLIDIGSHDYFYKSKEQREHEPPSELYLRNGANCYTSTVAALELPWQWGAQSAACWNAHRELGLCVR